MPAEILMPKEGVLIAGFHGPQIELDFVDIPMLFKLRIGHQE